MIASAVCCVAIALLWAHGKVAALLFVLVILSFVTANSYGYVDAPTFSVYSKGTRTFFFPVIQYYVYALFITTLLRDKLSDRVVLKGAGGGWMLAFTALFACQAAYGLSTGIPADAVFSTDGLLNVVHMSMIVYVVVSALRDERSFALLIRMLLAVAVLRGCYGLARFFVAGGDPQNAYSNIDSVALRITFWDANEGLIGSLVVFYCMDRLVRGWSSLSLASRAFFAVAIAIELSVILLSFRRTSWYGLLLAAGYFAFRLPRNSRAAIARVAVLLMLVPVAYLTTARYREMLGQSNLSLVERIAPDVAKGGGISNPSSRFYELYRAFDTVKRHPLLGVGAWGEFEVGASDVGLEYHHGNFGFVHSGFGHVLLKSGVVGLVIFLGILISGWRFASHETAALPATNLALFDSFRAGLVFMLPTLLFGGLINEFRTMALLGLLLAVPIAVVRLASRTSPESFSAAPTS